VDSRSRLSDCVGVDMWYRKLLWLQPRIGRKTLLLSHNIETFRTNVLVTLLLVALENLHLVKEIDALDGGHELATD